MRESRFAIFTKPGPLITCLFVLQLVIAMLSVNLSFTAEESMWQYIGWNWFHNGLPPYTGGVDNKTPLIFAIFGLSFKLFGVNYWFPRLLGTVCQTIGIYYLYKIADHIAGRQSALFTTTLYGLSLMWKTTGGYYVSFTETYAVMFVIAAFYNCIVAGDAKRYFLAGILAGAGFAFRFSAGFGIAAIFFYTIRKDKKGAVLFTAGVLTSILIITALLVARGVSVQALLHNALLDNFGAGSTTDHNLSWKLTSFMDSFFYAEIILFYPFIALYFLLNKKLNFIGVWLICTFIGINVLGIYARNHFKELLPAMALLSGLAIGQLTTKYKVPFSTLLVMVWIAFFPKTIEPLANLKVLVHPQTIQSQNFCAQPYRQPDEYAEKQLGLWIKDNTVPTDRVFVAGFGARVQAYAERISLTIYFNVTQTAVAKQTLFNDLGNSKAALLAIPLFPEYKNYVQPDIRTLIDSVAGTNYNFTGCMYGYGIYRLK